jgi:hypothetical protein
MGIVMTKIYLTSYEFKECYEMALEKARQRQRNWQQARRSTRNTNAEREGSSEFKVFLQERAPSFSGHLGSDIRFLVADNDRFLHDQRQFSADGLKVLEVVANLASKITV